MDGGLLLSDSCSSIYNFELDLDSYTVIDENDPWPPAGEQPRGKGWRRRACTAVWKSWFLREFVMMIRLAVPVVSIHAFLR